MTLDLLSGLSRDLSWLLGDSNDHDILIHAGEVPNTKGFKAHTNILRARSLYFRAVLSGKHSTYDYNDNDHSLVTSSVFVTPPGEDKSNGMHNNNDGSNINSNNNRSHDDNDNNNNGNNNYNNYNNNNDNKNTPNKKPGNVTVTNTTEKCREWYQLNISPDTFEVMLKFMYSGRIDLEAESDTQKIIDYLLAADILWLYQLLEHIQIYLIQNRYKWLQQNFVRIYSLLHANPATLKKLHQYSQSILFTQPQVLFNSPQYHTLSQEMIISLLKKNYVQIGESELWIKVLEWGIRQNSEITNKDVDDWDPENLARLQRTLLKIFPLIRFEKMSFEDFNEKVRPYKSIFPIEFYEKISNRFQNINDIDQGSSVTPLNSTPENSKLRYGSVPSKQNNETMTSSSKSIISLSPPTSPTKLILQVTPATRPTSPKSHSLAPPIIHSTSPDGLIPPVTSVSRSTSPDVRGLIPPVTSITRSTSPDVYGLIPPATFITRSTSPDVHGLVPPVTPVTHSTSPEMHSPPKSPTTNSPTSMQLKPAIRKKVSYQTSSLIPHKSHKNSTIISRTHLALISGWIDGRDLSSPEDASYSISNVPYRFRLLCRGSRHGFDDKMFHKRCDNQGPTVTVIKIKGFEGMVIGGYNPLNWQSPWIRKFEKCHHSFIFSICTDDSEKKSKENGKHKNDMSIPEEGINRNLIMSTTPVKSKSIFSRAELSKYAISLHRSTGPAFGTTDLVMRDGIVKCKPECYMLDLLKNGTNGARKGSLRRHKISKKSHEDILGSNLTDASSNKTHKKNDSNTNNGEDNFGFTHNRRLNKSTGDLVADIFNNDLNRNEINFKDNGDGDGGGINDTGVKDAHYDINDKSYLEFDDEIDPLAKPYHFLVEEYEVYAILGKNVT